MSNRHVKGSHNRRPRVARGGYRVVIAVASYGFMYGAEYAWIT